MVQDGNTVIIVVSIGGSNGSQVYLPEQNLIDADQEIVNLMVLVSQENIPHRRNVTAVPGLWHHGRSEVLSWCFLVGSI